MLQIVHWSLCPLSDYKNDSYVYVFASYHLVLHLFGMKKVQRLNISLRNTFLKKKGGLLATQHRII